MVTKGTRQDAFPQRDVDLAHTNKQNKHPTCPYVKFGNTTTHSRDTNLRHQHTVNRLIYIMQPNIRRKKKNTTTGSKLQPNANQRIKNRGRRKTANHIEQENNKKNKKNKGNEDKGENKKEHKQRNKIEKKRA